MFKMFVKYSVVTGAVFITVWDNICYFSRVDGPSMQPTINSGEQKNFVFIVRPLTLKSMFCFQPPEMESVLKRGDVVSLISPKNPKECFLKRVVGLPGDLVKTIHYKKKYVLVPKGHCWIEGDNFKKSYDSNAFGCVPMGLVLGQAKLILFPNLTTISNELPEHRSLKKLAKKQNKYLIDFQSDSHRRGYKTDEDDYLEYIDDKDEEEDEDDNNDSVKSDVDDDNDDDDDDDD